MGNQVNVDVKKRWIDLSWRQLIEYHSMRDVWLQNGGKTSDIVFKIKALLILIECDIAEVQYDELPKLSKNSTMEDVDSALQFMWECVAGKHRMVTLRKWDAEAEPLLADRKNFTVVQQRTRRDGKRDKTGEFWQCEWDELVGAATELTKWLENTGGLIKLPEKFVKINGEWYGLPDALMVDVSYEQYSDVQSFMAQYWNVVDNLSSSLESAEAKPQLTEKELRVIAENLAKWQRNFIAAILRRTERYTGKGARDNDEKDLVKLPYSSMEQERIRDGMGDVPRVLFSVLLQYVQSVLEVYKKSYPHLFKGNSDGKKARNMLVAEQGMIIGLMQEGGFSSIEAVRMAEVGMVFKALDMLNEKAEEMKKAMAKTKGKGKKT